MARDIFDPVPLFLVTYVLMVSELFTITIDG